MGRQGIRSAFGRRMAEFLPSSPFLLVLLCSTPAHAQDIPACALTGSSTVMIGGKPALRLSDVAACPPSLYEIIASVRIDGQPMVHFRSGLSGKTRCAALGTVTVEVENKQASTLGSVTCGTVQ